MKPERAILLETNIKKRALDAERHLRALEAAAADFGDDFDLDAFELSWRSDDPNELMRAYAVQAGYENALNNCIKSAQELCELEGWSDPGFEPNAVGALKLLHENGVISARTRTALKNAQERRSVIQHDYANVTVREVYDSAREVLDHGPLLLQEIASQLRQREG